MEYLKINEFEDEAESEIEIFGRVNKNGNIDILHYDDGAPVTRFDANIYPVGSDMLSVRYEHPEGIVLTREDARKLGIPIEDEVIEKTNEQIIRDAIGSANYVNIILPIGAIN